jgi:hypothetical protein
LVEVVLQYNRGGGGINGLLAEAPIALTQS